VVRGLRLLTPVAALTCDCKYTLAILRCAGSDEVPTVSRNSHYHLASIIATHTRTNTHTHNFVSLPRFLSFSDTHTLPSTPVAALVSSLGAVPNSGAPALLLLSLLFGIMKPLLASTRPSAPSVCSYRAPITENWVDHRMAPRQWKMSDVMIFTSERPSWPQDRHKQATQAGHTCMRPVALSVNTFITRPLSTLLHCLSILLLQDPSPPY
jgi:hypothetical protein